MAIVLRIIGVSLATAGLGAVPGQVMRGGNSDAAGVSVVLASFGAIIGAIAGATREIVAAQRRKPEW